MKIVLDTNVWLSAFITRGSCHELIRHCLRHHQLIISEFIFDEIEGHLSDKFKFPPDKVKKIQKFIKENTEKVAVPPLESPVCRDPEDDAVLSTMSVGEVDCLITGDNDLLVLKSFQNIPILTPKGFWEFEKKIKQIY